MMVTDVSPCIVTPLKETAADVLPGGATATPPFITSLMGMSSGSVLFPFPLGPLFQVRQAHEPHSLGFRGLFAMAQPQAASTSGLGLELR